MFYKNIILIFFLIGGITSCGTSRFHSAKVISNKELDYPLNAQLEHMEGDVLLKIFVNDKGSPEEINLEESSNYPDLDKAALEFAKSVEFQPAELDGKPIGAWTRLKLRYRLSKVYFQEDKWFNDVLYYLDKAEHENDAITREHYLKKLFTNYSGMVNYVELNDDMKINKTIQKVISSSVKNRWKKFWKTTPAPFTIYDDFLERFPESQLSSKVKEELIRLLINKEYELRISYLKSKSLQPELKLMIDSLKKRMDELQNFD